MIKHIFFKLTVLLTLILVPIAQAKIIGIENQPTTADGTTATDNTPSTTTTGTGSSSDTPPRPVSSASDTTQGSTSTQTSNGSSGGGGQCSEVNRDNYDQCCTGSARAANQGLCEAYDGLGVPVFGQTGSGVGTNPVNTGSTNDQSTGAAPQASSTELSQCSSIKFTSLLDILIWLKCIIVIAIIPLVFILAFLFFLWGVFRFIAASDSAKKEESKKFILWGLIGLFVMVSVWGILKILSTTLGLDTSVVPVLQTEYLKKQ